MSMVDHVCLSLAAVGDEVVAAGVGLGVPGVASAAPLPLSPSPPPPLAALDSFFATKRPLAATLRARCPCWGLGWRWRSWLRSGLRVRLRVRDGVERRTGVRSLPLGSAAASAANRKLLRCCCGCGCIGAC